MTKITVKDTEVNVIKVNGEDYICLTDMLRAKDGDFFITDWLRNRNTLEYIGIWEKVYNPDFNYGEFAIIRNQSGLNSFKISVKEFAARTNAISVRQRPVDMAVRTPIRILPLNLRCGLALSSKSTSSRNFSG